jgi:hypothetical protein
VVFLTHNRIYIQHISAAALPGDATVASARKSILYIIQDLHECINKQGDECQIEYVYLLGGLDSPGNLLADLGTIVTSL